jgi:hypothetical protein
LKNKLIFVFCLVTFLSSGQVRPEKNSPIGQTEKQKPAKKSIPAKVKSWKISEYGLFVDSVNIDTLLKHFHNYNPIFKNSITGTYTGNYGGSFLDNDFSKRNYYTEFYFLRNHTPYLLTPFQITYYNTTTPYTLLDYSQSENKNRGNETRFNVIHSQNINPNLNVTFRYDQAKSQGQYNYQENRNHFITLYSSYTRDRINLYGGFIFNRIFNGENGGITNEEDLKSVDQEFIPTRLLGAASAYKNNYIFANAEYKIGISEVIEEEKHFKPIAGVLYSFILSRNQKLFTEGKENDNSSYFANSWLNKNFSNDSVRFNTMTNQLQLNFYESALRKFSFGKRAFAGIESVNTSFAESGYEKAVFPFHEGTFEGNVYTGPSPRWYNKSYSNAYFGGGIYRETGQFWTWNFDGKQYFTGIKAGQTEINGIISKPVHILKDTLSGITIKGNLLNRTPDFFQQKYFSNRIKWSKDLVNEQIMNAAFTFLSPRYHLETGARYTLFNNFIYHDTLGIPSQTKSQILILSAFINKEFKWHNLNLLTQILWQKASAPQYIHLPDFSSRLVISYNLVLAKVLFLEVGADTRYNTAYYADAYHPVTGLFYLQYARKLGNYPYIDAFINGKLKRTRVFFQYMNLGSLFLSPSYFTALHYPMNKATFRFGVSWSFYD